jgi:hypothetical protein
MYMSVCWKVGSYLDDSNLGGHLGAAYNSSEWPLWL